MHFLEYSSGDYRLASGVGVQGLASAFVVWHLVGVQCLLQSVVQGLETSCGI